MDGKVKKKRGRKPKEINKQKEDINKITEIVGNHIIKLNVQKQDNNEIDGYIEVKFIESRYEYVSFRPV